MTGKLDEEHQASLKLFVVLSKAYRAIMDRAVKDMRKFDLSPSEFTILEVLYTKGKIPLQQIGEKILITSGSMTYNIDKLEIKALIRRVPCSSDRRVIYAEISDSGKKLFDHIFPKHAETIHSLMKALSLEEKLETTEMIKKLGKGALE
ncbi:MarR family winged helix-turn-helix transcriptional regulator [Paenibacillus nasutitermitis]|uniref:MarR family transcriptional regulator n=1 Tax=Paenibacillus nasutitermitis TaxID=1652958 RepID=A0A917DSN0_9BACL|nr:MarR family transcriptional regulator [Paenibacillus nasutitermitis]GGD66354.1 MarR family transcriptional regulator [Paenibacillus nasutitermitis]